MSLIREKLKSIRARFADLSTRFPSGDCVLISMPSDTHNTVGGMTMEMPIENAAQHLVEGTHRLAADSEIKAFREQQVAARQAIEASAAARGCVYIRTVEKPK
jgi:hypothetical protein